jgi:hypothetical protein
VLDTRPPVYFTRARLGTPNPVGIPSISLGRPPRRFVPRAKYFYRLGVQNHGSIRPYPLPFPGVTAPHLLGPDGATLSVSQAQGLAMEETRRSTTSRRRPSAPAPPPSLLKELSPPPFPVPRLPLQYGFTATPPWAAFSAF